MKEEQLKEIISNALTKAIKENPEFDKFGQDFGQLMVKLLAEHPDMESTIESMAKDKGDHYMDKYLGEIMESTGLYKAFEDGYVKRITT